MSEEKDLIAERWVSPEHECPYCGHVQNDAWGEREWACEKCGETYLLPALDDLNDRE